MNALPFLLALLPTTVWVLVWLWLRPRKLSAFWLLSGMLLGALLGGPVWVAETWVGELTTPTGRFSRDFDQQVLGASCCEELLKFAAVVSLVLFASRRGQSSARAVVAIAVSVGIGFMTLENVVAVVASESPMRLAIDRQVTMLAGHPGYQVVMGWCLYRWTVSRQARWAIASLAVPIFLHGWADFSEALFQDEQNHGSTEDTVLFFAWIASIFVTAAVAAVLLHRTRNRPHSNGG
jgi:RsiW-degrading membrane proteinase PrsW (M82 family)